ncbi:MAG: hypothetical protein WCL13_03455, partial [bacterium]
MAEVNYNISLGASENNKTLSLINGTWYEAMATPGKENVLSMNLSTNQTANSTNQTIYTNNLKIEQKLNFTLINSSKTAIFELTNTNYY